MPRRRPRPPPPPDPLPETDVWLTFLPPRPLEALPPPRLLEEEGPRLLVDPLSELSSLSSFLEVEEAGPLTFLPFEAADTLERAGEGVARLELLLLLGVLGAEYDSEAVNFLASAEAGGCSKGPLGGTGSFSV